MGDRVSAPSIPLHAIAPAAAHLATIGRDGVMRIDAAPTPAREPGRAAPMARGSAPPQASSSAPRRGQPIGEPSARLTEEWRATRRGIVELIDAGLVTALIHF